MIFFRFWSIRSTPSQHDPMYSVNITELCITCLPLSRVGDYATWSMNGRWWLGNCYWCQIKEGLQWPVSICRRHTALLLMLASPRCGAWCGSVPIHSARIGPNGWVMKHILPAWSGLPITHLSNRALLVFRIMSYSQEPKKYANFKRIATMFKYEGKN